MYIKRRCIKEVSVSQILLCAFQRMYKYPLNKLISCINLVHDFCCIFFASKQRKNSVFNVAYILWALGWNYKWHIKVYNGIWDKVDKENILCRGEGNWILLKMCKRRRVVDCLYPLSSISSQFFKHSFKIVTLPELPLQSCIFKILCHVKNICLQINHLSF